MKIAPATDHGQELPLFKDGRVIGFVDTAGQCDAAVEALNREGVVDGRIRILAGEDGVAILNRTLKEFFFSDGEDQTAIQALEELRDGHYALEIAAGDRDEAIRVTNIAAQHGGRTFTYFGKWMNEHLT
jgi:hypothetical protein